MGSGDPGSRVVGRDEAPNRLHFPLRSAIRPSLLNIFTELGNAARLERTLFTLDWFQDMDLRRRVQIGLNKGEARNTLAEAVFLNRLGEVRDRSFENQRYRASGLNLVVAAIVLWNTVYLERAVDVLRSRGVEVSDVLLPHVSPLGWEHISLTGDYIWKKNRRVEQGSLRSMRGLHNA